jgi:hypothetical protein
MGMRDKGRAVIGYGGVLKGRKQPNFNISKLINNFEKSTGLNLKLKKHCHDFITVKCYVRTEPVFAYSKPFKEPWVP